MPSDFGLYLPNVGAKEWLKGVVVRVRSPE